MHQPDAEAAGNTADQPDNDQAAAATEMGDAPPLPNPRPPRPRIVAGLTIGIALGNLILLA